MQTYTAREYLKIDIANSFGLDKKDWDERIEWFDANADKLPSLVKTADEPALFYAGMRAWQDVQAGIPIGYTIALDACSSGLQLLACLTTDVLAAKLCGVINTGHREDSYTSIYQAILALTGSTAKVTRDMVKAAIMTALYGSEEEPKKVFGEGDLLAVFYETMSKMAPYAWNLNQLFLAIWDPTVTMHSWVLPDNFHVHVKVMASVKETIHYLDKPYEITYKVNQGKEKGRSLSANSIHSVDGMVVREMGRRCNYDLTMVTAARQAVEDFGRDEPAAYVAENIDKGTEMLLTLWEHYKTSGYLSARILDYITELNARYVGRTEVLELINSMPKKPFQILTVHDCFRCLPSYGNDLRQQYRYILAMIAKSKMLDSLLSQIMQKPVNVPKPNPDMWKQVLEADYMLS